MKTRGRLFRRMVVGTVLGTVVVSVSTLTLAAIPDTATGVITGCFSTTSGVLRVIDAEAGATCRGGERQVTWNHTGPQGPAGKDGINGTNGLNGSDGKTVLSGAGAPASTMGTDGDFYLDTAAAVLWGPKSGGAWPTAGVSLVGPQGPAGKDGINGTNGLNGSDGKTVLSGAGAPASTMGTDGDFYLDTAAAVLWGPKSGGAWPTAGVSLVGPQGSQGPQGPAGPQGPQGSQGPQGAQGPPGPPGVGLNPLQLALQRWYQAADGIKVDLTATPGPLAFDGAHVWVAAQKAEGSQLVKVRAADGAIAASVDRTHLPEALAFDGVNIWALSHVSSTEATSSGVTRIRAADGSEAGEFAVQGNATDIIFDGSSIWVATTKPSDDSIQPAETIVTKLRASDGARVGGFTIGAGSSSALAFDGASVWVASRGKVGAPGTLSKLRASDGAEVRSVTVGVNPSAVVFDGASVWVANRDSDSVTKIQASDGTVLGTFRVGDGPSDLAFDGAHIWVANSNGGDLTKLRASDGVVMATFGLVPPTKVGSCGSLVCPPTENSRPSHLAFDGANIWVSDDESNVLWKL